MSFTWAVSFRRVFDRFKEPIQINGLPAEALVPTHTRARDKTLDEFGIVEATKQEVWLLPETEVEVGDEVSLRGKKYRVVEVTQYMNVAKKVVLESAEV